MGTVPRPLPLPLLTLIFLIVLHIQYVQSSNTSSSGLAWANGDYVPMTSFTGPNTHISAYYTWSPDPVSDAPFPFIPMLWGCNSTYTLPFHQAVQDGFDGVGLTADRAILGFNEPDLAGQAECTPAEAASAWMYYLEPLKGRFRLGSPAVTSGPGGKQWMLDWFQACGGGCNPDFIALHWYDIDPQIFIEHIRDFHDTWNLSIWITEYAVQNFSQDATQATLEDIETFMDVTTSYMQSVDWVERDFWFGAMYDMQGVNSLDCLFDRSSGNVTDHTGALSPLGVKYAGISSGQVEVSSKAWRRIRHRASASQSSLPASIASTILLLLCVL